MRALRRHMAAALLGAVLTCALAGVGASDVDVAAEAGRVIFVPAPKGAGESLDTTGKPAAGEPRLDCVATTADDTLHGTVLSIDANDGLRLSGPSLSGEARLRFQSLDSVVFGRKSGEAGGDTVTLTNDDRLDGAIESLTLEHLVLKSPSMGTLKILRPFVRSLNFAGGTDVLVDCYFEDGDMTPWFSANGSWKLEDGVVFSESQGQQASLAAKLDQKEAVTMVAELESGSGRNMHCNMLLFAEDPKHPYGRESVFAMVTNYEYYVQYCRNGGTNQVANGRYSERNFTKAVFRFAYDPGEGKVLLWMNRVPLGEWVIPHPPRHGSHVALTSHQPVRILSIKVLPGVVPPPDKAAEGDEEQAVAFFENKDRVSMKDVLLADGMLSGTTSYGVKIEAPVKNLRSVTLPTKGQQRPRRRNEDVVVETAGSRMTVQFRKLNDESLQGEAECAGDVAVSRDALRKMRFNIYR